MKRRIVINLLFVRNAISLAVVNKNVTYVHTEEHFVAFRIVYCSKIKQILTNVITIMIIVIVGLSKFHTVYTVPTIEIKMENDKIPIVVMVK